MDDNKTDEVPAENTKDRKLVIRVIFLIDTIIFGISGAALIVLSLIFLIKARSFSILFLATSISGLVAMGVSVLGFFGWQYGKKEKESNLRFLVLHFAVAFVSALLIALFAGFCFLFTDFGTAIMMINWNSYKNLVDTTSINSSVEPESEINLEIERYLTNYYYIGGIAAFLFLIIVVGLGTGGCVLGILKVVKFILFVGAFSIIFIGVLCMVVGIYFVAAYRFLDAARGLTIAVIVMGFVMAILGIGGSCIGLSFQRHRVFLLLYLVALVLFLVGFVCMGGVFFVLGSSEEDIVKYTHDFCDVKESVGAGMGTGLMAALGRTRRWANNGLPDNFCGDIETTMRKIYKCDETSGNQALLRDSLDLLRNMCEDPAKNVLAFLIRFIQQYYKLMGFACFLFGGYLLVNIILVFICIIRPFSDFAENDQDDEDKNYYGKRINEKEHKNDPFLSGVVSEKKHVKPKTESIEKVVPMDDY